MENKSVRMDVVVGLVAGVIGLLWISAIWTSLVFPPPAQAAGGGVFTGGTLREHEWGFGSFTKGGPEFCVKTGQTVTFNLTNDGKNLHGFQIVRADGTFVAGLNKTELLRPTQVRQITFKIDQPGNYFYICPVTGHRAKGMVAPCVVQSGCSGL